MWLDWKASHFIINYDDFKKISTTYKDTDSQGEKGDKLGTKLCVKHILTKVQSHLRFWLLLQSSKLLFTEEARIVRHDSREQREARGM